MKLLDCWTTKKAYSMHTKSILQETNYLQPVRYLLPCQSTSIDLIESYRQKHEVSMCNYKRDDDGQPQHDV